MTTENTEMMPEEISGDKSAFYTVIEALIFSSDSPLSVQRLKEILPDFSPKELKTAIEFLNDHYQKSGRSFEIKEIAGGYQMFTLPEYATYLEQLYQGKQKSRLTQKALETLAIIAYKQPITKHEIEDIRGVNADGVVKNLISRDLITISGRAQAPGSPFLYKTTRQFLDYFGLSTLDDLPKLKEFEELIDVEDETNPYHEKLLKEISPNLLGMKENGNGNGDKDTDGETEETAAENTD